MEIHGGTIRGEAHQRVNLLDALNGKYSKVRLVEGEGAVCIDSNVSAFGDGTVLMVWKSKLPKSKGERFHTIQLRKMENI
jgi:hypothetical protein